MVGEEVISLVKIVRIKGLAVRADVQVQAPKKRWNLPCYDTSTCQIDYCRLYDRIVKCKPTPIQQRMGVEPRIEIHRKPCGRDNCKSRVNLYPVSVKVCKNCKYAKVYAGERKYHVSARVECERYVIEAMREAEKFRTPYGRDRRIFRRGGQDHWYGGHVI